MREIKFRAWDNRKCKMVSWIDMLKHKGVMWGVLGKIKTTTYQHQNDKVGTTTIDYAPMQYTGLKDKNDSGSNQVYEGDILTNATGNFYKVEWDYKDTGWCGIQINNTEKHRLVTLLMSGSIVIGNIYENKELLEKKC